MKIDLYRCNLDLIVTLGCNASCGHCLFSCSPWKARYRLTKEEMIQACKDAVDAGICSVCFNGGESFLFLEDLLESIMSAVDLGMDVAVRTNVFWATTDELTKKVIFLLKHAGVRSIGLSYDHYHSEFINVRNVKRVLAATERFNLHTWLDWVGLDSMKDVWQALGRYTAYVRGKPDLPQAVGRAEEVKFSAPERLYTPDEIEFSLCHSFRCGDYQIGNDSPSLTIFPGGYIGLDTCCLSHPRLIFKKPEGKDWIRAAKDKVENDPARDFLYRYGVKGLIGKARRKYPNKLQYLYVDDCDVCFEFLELFFPRPDSERIPDYIHKEYPSYNSIESARRGERMERRLIPVIEKIISSLVPT